MSSFTSSDNIYLFNKEEFNFFKTYRKKYPFIFNPKSIIHNDPKELSKKIFKINEKYCGILRRENNKIFDQNFSLINKERFVKKWQNILDEYGIKDNEKIKINENYDDDIRKINENKNLIKTSSLLWHKILIKKMNKLTLKNKITNKNHRIKFSFNKFKKELIYIKSKINIMPISLSEIIETYRKPKKSFHFKKTYDLIFAIKTKNLRSSCEILENNKFLVLDRDYMNMTALHWAAKNNFYQIIPKIMEYGSHTEKKDFIGDNPLLIALKKNYIESVAFLFLYLSSPFVRDKERKNIFQCSGNDYILNNICDVITKIHLKSVFIPTKNLFESIQKQFLDYIINELKPEIEADAYEIACEINEFYKRKKNKFSQK